MRARPAIAVFLVAVLPGLLWLATRRGAQVDDVGTIPLRDGGHPIKVQVVDGASPGDFLTLGTAASDATIAQVLDVARQ